MSGQDKQYMHIENLPQAFALCQVFTDDNSNIVDYIILKVNAAFEKMFGLSGQNIIGKKAADILPDFAVSIFDWLNVYQEEETPGKNICLKHFIEPLGQWYDITAIKDDPESIAIIFRDMQEHESPGHFQQDSEKFELEDIINVKECQSLMEEFYGLTKLPMSIIDLQGKMLVAFGLQDICTQFHRAHPETRENCLDSDLGLSSTVLPGEFKLARCKNNMWEIATPIVVNNTRLGSIFMGQFFFSDEPVDYALFQAQARKYGFDEKKYIAALEQVPCYSRETIHQAMRFFTKMARLISIQGHYTISYFRTFKERRQIEEDLQYQLQFEKIVADISSYFISLPAEQLNEGIGNALKKAGEFFQVDRCHLFQFSADGQTRSLTHEWCAEGIKPQKDRLQEQPLFQLPWWTKKLKTKSCIRVLEIDDLPPDAEGERREFKAQNLSSIICVPIMKEEKLIGALGFDSVKQKIKWTKAHETLLTMVAELISISLARFNADETLKASEEKYREILSAIEEGYYEVDLAGNFVFLNDSFCNIFGYNRSELIGKSYKMLYRDPANVYKTYNRVYRTGKPEKAADWPVITRDGREIFVELSISLLRDKAGNPSGFRGIARDVTERRQAEDKLHELEALQQLLINLATECINVPLEMIDANINQMLKAVGKFTKVDRAYVFKHDYNHRITSNTHEWCAEGIVPQKDNLLAVPFDIISHILETHQKGEVVYFTNINSMLENDNFLLHLEKQDIKSTVTIPIYEEGVNTGFVGFDAVNKKKVFAEKEITLLKVLAEITSYVLSRQKREQKVHHMSFHDQLTGLYNRYFLEEEMARLDTARQLPLAVIMADLNGLKLVNDTYGHKTGDQLLKTAVAIIKDSCRQEDIIARWGGDEFVVLLPQTVTEEARLICDRIAGSCQNTYVEDVPLSIATGIASKTCESKSLAETLSEAENEMYDQKLSESRSTKIALLTSLLNALAKKSFETEGHTSKMQVLAKKIGRSLNLTDTETQRLGLLITLHDIGMINISENILTKEGSLTDDEWEAIKKHPARGYRIARGTEDFAHVAEDILTHHERWDGTGYPQGLKGRQIPLLARITAVVDAYEVMSTGRPYKKAISKSAIAAELRRCSGTQFDPELIEIFLMIMEEDR